ncbi:MAG TPA: hypothetical protein VJK66_04200 [Gaiellaceae bacterium]|nr:hypothetical protein [Gaiellaceae bacterium]
MNAPLEERLDDADAAVVGRIVDDKEDAGSRLLTIDVDQRVKGDVPKRFEARSPSGTSCDIPELDDEAIGLLLSRDGSAYSANLCSVVGAGELVVVGGEPRGGPIKVVVGLAILGLVLLWSLRRLRHGTRPRLPGAPEP